jgi:hypothetical protein
VGGAGAGQFRLHGQGDSNGTKMDALKNGATSF